MIGQLLLTVHREQQIVSTTLSKSDVPAVYETTYINSLQALITVLPAITNFADHAGIHSKCAAESATALESWQRNRQESRPRTTYTSVLTWDVALEGLTWGVSRINIQFRSRILLYHNLCAKTDAEIATPSSTQMANVHLIASGWQLSTCRW